MAKHNTTEVSALRKECKNIIVAQGEGKGTFGNTRKRNNTGLEC